jgi:hypothetical protein
MPTREAAGPGIYGYGAFSWFWTFSPLDLSFPRWFLRRRSSTIASSRTKKFDSLDERKGSGSSSLSNGIFLPVAVNLGVENAESAERYYKLMT